MTAYYNENDPFAAAWLRELITAGHIAPGIVDERSIEDVKPYELAQYTQCHFFAGIGGWSYALRLAKWPDNRPVWTGSCPCQPFSAAGKGAGVVDERHLWPAWFHLIEQCQPEVVFGEQVDAAIRHGWLDLVQDDLEASGYAFAAFGIPAAYVGAPHIRQRLWFVADCYGSRLRPRRASETSAGQDPAWLEPPGLCASGDLANPDGEQPRGVAEALHARQSELSRCSSVGNATSERLQRPRGESKPEAAKQDGGLSGLPSNPWAGADWLECVDGKARPVEPGTFPLAHGVPARVGRLRGYGNAIVPQVAKEFIAAYLQTRE